MKAWITAAPARGRLLIWDPRVALVWWLAAAVLLIEVLLALVFHPATERGVAVMNQRPGYTITAAVLTLILVPLVFAVLVLSIAGVLVAPVLLLLFGVLAVFGRVVVLAWIGRCLAGVFGGRRLPVAAAVPVGGVAVALLYLVPLVGVLVWTLVGALGLGMAVAAILLPTDAAVSVVRVGNGDNAAPVTGFWIRLTASCIDALLVGALTVAIGTIAAFPVLFVLYCSVLWSLRGTTVGGAICGLKLVRLDDGKVGWTVAVVRALSGFLSLVCAGIGFFWAAADRHAQSWHDKVTGTTIVRARRGVSLV